MNSLAIIVPTRGRAQLLVPLAKNIAATTKDYQLYFVIDDDDVDSFAALTGVNAEIIVSRVINPERAAVGFERPTLPQKMNLGCHVSTEQYIFIANDDVLFYEGWIEAADEYCSPFVDVIGTNDLHNPDVLDGKMATQFFLTRRYIERGGPYGEPVFCERYHHQYVDTEFCWIAKHRGVYAHADDSIVEHLHPCWGNREEDATDRSGWMAHGERDLEIHTRRMARLKADPEAWDGSYQASASNRG